MSVFIGTQQNKYGLGVFKCSPELNGDGVLHMPNHVVIDATFAVVVAGFEGGGTADEGSCTAGGRQGRGIWSAETLLQ